jgi:hypothetical protein
MTTKQLDELMDVGGGQTGTSKVPQPVAKTATLPNSKRQGDLSPQKLDGEVQDTDSENNTNSTGDMSASNKSSVSMKEDMEALFGGEELTEEFKSKVTTIFEAAVHAKVEEIRAQLEEEYQASLEKTLSESIEEITGRIDDYMNYAVNEWMEENEVAIESSLRSDITEEFIDGLKQLFVEHYIEIPEDKLDVLGELAERVEELEEKLNEAVETNIGLNKSLAEEIKNRIFNEVSEGLVVTQSEKFKTLSEGVDFTDEDSYKQKLEIVKENYFADKKVKSVNLVESEIENAEEPVQKVFPASGPVANYVQAIARTIKK